MKSLRKLLFPFAGIYYLITLVRNKCYDWKWLPSKSFSFPVIVIGNLSTGGTGKSPMTEYIAKLFGESQETAILSRGYGRKTHGYRRVTPAATAREVGDEPLQFALNLPNVSVHVCENRVEGVKTICQTNPRISLIILDDAYQHRRLRPGYSILLTKYSDLYSQDYLLPVGNLREPRSGAERANLIVVTKCPPKLATAERNSISSQLRERKDQEVLFSTIAYSDRIFSKTNTKPVQSLVQNPITLVTGIADSNTLLNFLTSFGISYRHLAYPDHHIFTSKELEQLESLPFILTTQKDYMRLKDTLKNPHLYYLPIETEFLDSDEKRIKKMLQKYVKSATSSTL